MVKITKPITAVKASITIAGLLNQSRSCPKSSMSCNAPIHKIRRINPPRSILSLAVAVSAGLSRRIAAKAHAIPTGILIKKIQCQDMLSLMVPPKIGPRIGPTTVVIAHMPIAWDCFSGGKIRISNI